MIICICKNISDRQINELISAGANLKELKKITGASQQCGMCRSYIEDYFIESVNFNMEDIKEVN